MKRSAVGFVHSILVFLMLSIILCVLIFCAFMGIEGSRMDAGIEVVIESKSFILLTAAFYTAILYTKNEDLF